MAAAVEFVLEGLHLSKRLNKDAVGNQRHVPRLRLTLQRLTIWAIEPAPSSYSWANSANGLRSIAPDPGGHGL